MEPLTLDVDNAPSIRLEGELIAKANSSANIARADYSGNPGRWVELFLYKTATGDYVCHRIERTNREAKATIYSGVVCESESQIIEFFGHGWMTRSLCKQAGIEHVATTY